jgi:hypothetical protein
LLILITEYYCRININLICFKFKFKLNSKSLAQDTEGTMASHLRFWKILKLLSPSNLWTAVRALYPIQDYCDLQAAWLVCKFHHRLKMLVFTNAQILIGWR